MANLTRKADIISVDLRGGDGYLPGNKYRGTEALARPFYRIQLMEGDYNEPFFSVWRLEMNIDRFVH